MFPDLIQTDDHRKHHYLVGSKHENYGETGMAQFAGAPGVQGYTYTPTFP